MKKPHQSVRAEEPVLIGISSGPYIAPAPRMTAFVWSDEQDLDLVLADAKSSP
jgi:hypothetical protein